MNKFTAGHEVEIAGVALQASTDINPDNPLAVAQAIQPMYEALKMLMPTWPTEAKTEEDLIGPYQVPQEIMRAAFRALALAERKVE